MSYDELEMTIYGSKTIYGLICFTLILIMFYIFKDKKEEKNKNDLREKSRREKIKNFLKKNFVLSAFTLESMIWFCLLSYAYFTKNIILMYTLRNQLNYFGRGAGFFVLCVWLEDKNFKFLYYLGYVFVNIISSLIFISLILTLDIKIENSEFILLLLGLLLLSIGYFLLIQATYDSFKEMSYKKYKINEEKDSYEHKFEEQKEYHENNNLEVIEQFEKSKVEDEVKYSHKNNEELEISKEIEPKKRFYFKPFILGLIIITISSIFIKNCTSNKPSYTKGSVIQENGNYIVENDKFILKNLNGELFSVLNLEHWGESFNRLFEIKSGDKGTFSSKIILENDFSFSQTIKVYHPNNNILLELETKDIDISNFPKEMLKNILKDKNNISKIVSEQEKFNEYVEKGYINFKDSVLTIFFISEKNRIKARMTFNNKNFSDGFIELFYKNGNLNKMIYLKNGLPEGEIKSYYENGSLQGVGQFINGLEEGEWEEYYENGNLKNISYFSNGKLEGEQKFYFENGNLKNIIYFENGIPEGKYKEYHENGKLAISTTFKNGIQNGICEIYNRNGKLINKLYLYNWKN